MGRNLSEKDLKQHKQKALDKLESYLEKLISNPNQDIKNKADKLSFWLEDWTRFLFYEEHFQSAKLRRYKRGEIIKAHLGYNVGSEEGGLHYCVVLDKNNALKSPIITVIPLTSFKPSKHSNLPLGNIFLGNELYVNLNAKFQSKMRILKENIDTIKKHLHNSMDINKEIKPFVFEGISYDTNNINELRNILDAQYASVLKIYSEIQKMKLGSVALISQVRTISKIRIYNPKHTNDVLSGVKLSNEKLDLIDAEISRLFLK